MIALTYDIVYVFSGLNKLHDMEYNEMYSFQNTNYGKYNLIDTVL